MIRFRKQLFLLAAWLFLTVLAACSGEQASPANGILVSTQWLEDHINDPDLVLLHSGTYEVYDSVHIPGARLIIPGNFTINTPEKRNEMPPADSIVELLRQVGVGKNSRIILYHETARILSRTARVFVALDQVGLGEQSFLLDGGLPAWIVEGRESTDEITDFSYGTLASPEPVEVLIKADELEKQRWSPEVVLFDVRSEEEYYGTPARDEVPADGGHIEGAYFFPYQSILQDEQKHLFKSDAALKKLFLDAGMVPGKVNIVYCGSGIRASVSYLAARHLGYPVLLYDGSFEEWNKLELPLTGPVALPLATE